VPYGLFLVAFACAASRAVGDLDRPQVSVQRGVACTEADEEGGLSPCEVVRELQAIPDVTSR
jgi:hypothetical protein